MASVDRLDALKVSSPCTVWWDGMVGDERVRHCGSCRKDVYNVADMTREEALSLIKRAEGRVCMRLTYRADGTIATGSCRARLPAARERGPLAFVSMLLVMLAAEIWAQSFGLRALNALLGGESAMPSIRTEDVQKAPLVRIRPVKRHAERIVMGHVPLEGL